MIKLHYDFLNKRFDGLERKIETSTDKSERKSDNMNNEMNRRFEAMDRKMANWFMGLMGLIVFKGGCDLFVYSRK
jgi:tetrahydromethanopterin S-methyltransferase subunit G